MTSSVPSTSDACGGSAASDARPSSRLATSAVTCGVTCSCIWAYTVFTLFQVASRKVTEP